MKTSSLPSRHIMSPVCIVKSFFIFNILCQCVWGVRIELGVGGDRLIHLFYLPYKFMCNTFYCCSTFLYMMILCQYIYFIVEIWFVVVKYQCLIIWICSVKSLCYLLLNVVVGPIISQIKISFSFGIYFNIINHSFFEIVFCGWWGNS